MAGMRKIYTKCVWLNRFCCISGVLLSTMNGRYEENIHQVCGSTDFAVLVAYY